MAHPKRTRRLLFAAFAVLVLLALLYLFFSMAGDVEDAEQGAEQPTSAPSGESSSLLPGAPPAQPLALRIGPPVAASAA